MMGLYRVSGCIVVAPLAGGRGLKYVELPRIVYKVHVAPLAGGVD